MTIQSDESSSAAAEVPSEAVEMPDRPVVERMMAEAQQTPETRQHLISDLQDALGGRTVVSYFTSSRIPVSMDDYDADLLESVLQRLAFPKGLCLLINSPGGSGLAAERIVKLCRTYSGENFVAMVARSAKSAATMVALGAQEIIMLETAELGPIDTQVVRSIGGERRFIPAQAVIDSYEALLRDALNLQPTQRIEPFLQQLDRFEASDIEQLRSEQQLAEDIGRRHLASGAMSSCENEEDLEACLKQFTDWTKTRTHGRPIFADEATRLGLNVRTIPVSDPIANTALELYFRTDFFVSTASSKTIESVQSSVSLPA
jgi:ATP-dependent protease ClpP protease subunit